MSARPAPPPATVRHNDWRAVALPAAAAFVPALPVSVIVPCHQAPGALALTLAGLERQDWPAELLEVVVVDDGSEPPLELPAAALDLRAVRQPRNGFGLARARNAGVRAAAHDILVFLDGDVIPEAGLIRAHARWHHAVGDALTAGFCSYVLAAGLDAAAVRGRRGALAALFAGRPFDPPWLERHMARTADLTSRHPDLFRAVTGHNFGISRALFEDIGGFDESFARYGGEDTELAYRAQVRGALLVPVREAFGWHQGRWSEGRDRKRRDMDRQAGKLADLIAEPGFRPGGAAGRRTVPQLAVALNAGQAPVERVVRATEALLADPDGDLGVCIVAPPGQDAARARLERRYRREPRLRVASGPALLDAFPASPIRIDLAPDAVLRWAPATAARRVARLAAGLGDAAQAVAILDNGARVCVARAWALNRARRAGGSAADCGETRCLSARSLRTGRLPAPRRTRRRRGSPRPGLGRSAPRARAAHRMAVFAVAGRRRPLAAAREPQPDGGPGAGQGAARSAARCRDRRARTPRPRGVRGLAAHRACPRRAGATQPDAPRCGAP